MVQLISGIIVLYLWRIRYRHRLLVVSPPPTYYDGDDIGTTVRVPYTDRSSVRRNQAPPSRPLRTFICRPTAGSM